MAVRVVWRYRLQSYSTSVGLAVTGRVTTADGSGRDTVSGDRRMVSVVCLPDENTSSETLQEVSLRVSSKLASYCNIIKCGHPLWCAGS